MPIIEDIARGREFGLFCVAEPTPGELTFPASTDAVAAAGFPDMSQNPSYTDSEEIQTDTRGLVDQYQDMTPAGTVPIKIYARPSGVKGSVPMGDAILTSMFGKKTVNANTSVVYSPAILKPAQSIWYRRGPVVFFGRGGVVDQGKISATNKGAVAVETNIQFMEMGWAGLDSLSAAAASGAGTITVTNAKKFKKGARIYNKTKDDHATEGYEITGVNYTTNILTVSPVLVEAWETDDVIRGYLPTPTKIGKPIESRKTTITIGGVTKVLMSLDVTFADKIQMVDDEMTTSGFPEAYGEDRRTVKGTLKGHVRPADVQRIFDGFEGSEQAVSILFGNTDGYKLQQDMARCRIQVPKFSNGGPFVDWSCDFAALEANGEDSMIWTFK